MRASPPLLIQLGTFRVWRWVTAIAVATAAATLSAWAATAPEHCATLSWLVWAIGIAAAASIARWLWTVPTRPRQLLWDGQIWHVSTVRSGAVDDTCTGRIDVAVDTGAWMLLRFVPNAGPADPSKRHRTIWLPAERRAAPHDWHALRYTLHGNAHRTRLDEPSSRQDRHA